MPTSHSQVDEGVGTTVSSSLSSVAVPPPPTEKQDKNESLPLLLLVLINPVVELDRGTEEEMSTGGVGVGGAAPVGRGGVLMAVTGLVGGGERVTVVETVSAGETLIIGMSVASAKLSAVKAPFAERTL